jgi:hypothetical protein
MLMTSFHVIKSMPDNMDSIIMVSDFFAASIAGVHDSFWLLNSYKNLTEEFSNDMVHIFLGKSFRIARASC